MTSREFWGDDHWKWMTREYEECRRTLKHYGRPEDDFDRCDIALTRHWQNFLNMMLKDF